MAKNSATFLDINLSKYRNRLFTLYLLILLSLLVFALDTFAIFELLTNSISPMWLLGTLGLQSVFSLYSFFVGFSVLREYKEQYEVFQRQKYAEDLSYNTLVKAFSDDAVIFRNVSLGHGDIDLILVSTKGVYAIEVKSNRGTIYLDDNGFIHVKDGDTATKQYRRQVISEANRLKRYLDLETGSKNFVSPILLFPLAAVMKDIYLTNDNDRYKVPVLSLNGIVDYIREQETLIMNKERIESIVQAINKIIEGRVMFNE